MSKLDRIRHFLNENKAGLAIVSDPVTVNYLTGFDCDPHERQMFLFVYENREPALFVPALEVARASSVLDFPVFGYVDSENPWQKIKAGLASTDSSIIYAEFDNLNVTKFQGLQTVFEGRFENLTPFIQKMRVIKSADEIQKELKVQFDYMITEQEVDESAKVLQGHFTSKDAEYQKYVKGDMLMNVDGTLTENTGEFATNYEKEAKEQQRLHVFVCEVDGQTKYVVPVYGAGLWGAIWGYVALNEDKDTVYGTYFSHASETPGLGAEIATEHFQNEFVGKKTLENGAITLGVVKNGKVEKPDYQVDGISGGTITSVGVDAMLKSCLNSYLSFLTK